MAATVAMVDTAEMMTTTDGAKCIPFRSYILNTKKAVDCRLCEKSEAPVSGASFVWSGEPRPKGSGAEEIDCPDNVVCQHAEGCFAADFL